MCLEAHRGMCCALYNKCFLIVSLVIISFQSLFKKLKKSIFTLTSSDPSQLPIKDFAPRGYGGRGQRFGFTVGPVCFLWARSLCQDHTQRRTDFPGRLNSPEFWDGSHWCALMEQSMWLDLCYNNFSWLYTSWLTDVLMFWEEWNFVTHWSEEEFISFHQDKSLAQL